MIGQRTVLKLVNRQTGSRYKSLYANLTEKQHANLTGLAGDLYNQDKVRYEICRPPTENDANSMPNEEWKEVHECTLMYGSPELADHLSGHMYMSRSIVEGKCSQAFRVAEHVRDFNDQELQDCLRHCSKWPLKTVSESETLQRIVSHIDAECYKRAQANYSPSEMSFRTAFLFCLNLLKLKEPLFLSHLVKHHGQLLGQKHQVIYLLFVAFNNQPNVSEGLLILQPLLDSFDTFSPSELAVIHAGLKSLGNVDLKDLERQISNRFGFRFT